jgi:hypothetical protein
VSVTGKGILISQSFVNGKICGEISSQVQEMDVADAAFAVGVSSSLPD